MLIHVDISRWEVLDIIYADFDKALDKVDHRNPLEEVGVGILELEVSSGASSGFTSLTELFRACWRPHLSSFSRHQRPAAFLKVRLLCLPRSDQWLLRCLRWPGLSLRRKRQAKCPLILHFARLAGTASTNGVPSMPSVLTHRSDALSTTIFNLNC